MGRRIDRRLVLHQIESLSEYLSYLKERPREVQQPFQDLSITVTSFFRDPEAFEAPEAALRERVVMSKEEAYSVACFWQRPRRS